MTTTMLQGDCLTVLPTLAAGSVQCVITSPPYFGLRSYSDDPREIGREPIPDCLAWARSEPPCGACFVCALRAVFAQLWRVLRDDGTAFLNLGDSYNSASNYSPNAPSNATSKQRSNAGTHAMRNIPLITGIKEKNLLMIPARVALALQADGWIIRNDNIWAKLNPMPESVQDRCTRAHEYVFMLVKQARYFYDAEAVAEPSMEPDRKRGDRIGHTQRKLEGRIVDRVATQTATRNRRTVWTLASQPVKLAHFATMPEALVEICLKSGSAARACQHCGAAWGRVVEHIKGDTEAHERPKRTAGMESKTSTLSLSGNGSKEWAERGRKRTDLGFAPRCACADNTGAASSVVLDPFGGSGTVAKVADRFGRDAILIDLNADYIDLQEQRTNGVQKELFV